MPARPSHISALLIIAFAAPCAIGQPSNWRTLQTIEPGVADLGPLSVSARFLPVDLRVPMGFDRVFRVPGSSRGVDTFGAPNSERLARVSGGITAVFPRSEYVSTKEGVRPTVPANTVYYIGNSPLTSFSVPDVPAILAPNAAPNGMSLQLPTFLSRPATATAQPADFRVHPGEDTTFREDARPLRPDDPRPAANVFCDEHFRRARVRALLMAAVADRE